MRAFQMRDRNRNKKFFHAACWTKFLRAEIPLWEAPANQMSCPAARELAFQATRPLVFPKLVFLRSA